MKLNQNQNLEKIKKVKNTSQNTSQNVSIRKNKISFIVRLLDDPSPNVRNAIHKEILNYGSEIESELKLLDAPLNVNQKNIFFNLLFNSRVQKLKNNWINWLKEASEKKYNYYDTLENGFATLSDYFYSQYIDFSISYKKTNRLEILIDDLATSARRDLKHLLNDTNSAVKLSNYLFSSQLITGNTSKYYDIENCDLARSLEKSCGNPTSLGCIFILVANRLGIKLHGCDFPGHFLVKKSYLNDSNLLFDCFNDGQVFKDAELAQKMAPSAPEVLKLINITASPINIVSRQLRNIKEAFLKGNRLKDANVIDSLISYQSEFNI